MLIECAHCHKQDHKINTGLKNKRFNWIFINIKGKRWVGAKCPDCVRQAHTNYSRLRHQENAIKYNKCCMDCGTSFQTTYSFTKFCSKVCRQQFYYKNKPPKPLKEVDYKIREHSKLIYKHCVECSKLYTTCRSASKFCTRQCCNTHQYNKPNAKRLRKLKKKAYNEKRGKQGISKFFILDLIAIYDHRPADMEVDHIIPLNGKNVSGLHVPWNLQYLTPEENNTKSNRLIGLELSSLTQSNLVPKT